MGAIWFDDGFSEHHKLKLVGTIGRALQFDAICYAAREQTNGFVPSTFPFLAAEDLRIDEVVSAVAKLEVVGVWDGVDGGWIIHDYSEYHPMQADLKAGWERIEQRVEDAKMGFFYPDEDQTIADQVENLRVFELFGRLIAEKKVREKSKKNSHDDIRSNSRVITSTSVNGLVAINDLTSNQLNSLPQKKLFLDLLSAYFPNENLLTQGIISADAEQAMLSAAGLDATTYHNSAVVCLSSIGFQCHREFPVDLEGDRGGRIDILAIRGNERIAIECDWRTPKQKSLEKLAAIQGASKVIMLREPNVAKMQQKMPVVTAPVNPNTPKFEDFWAIYPRKVGKQDAMRAWSKLDDTEKNAAFSGIALQLTWPQMVGETKYIPHPASWLNGRRWEDEDVPRVVRPELGGRVGLTRAELLARTKTGDADDPKRSDSVIDVAHFGVGQGNH